MPGMNLSSVCKNWNSLFWLTATVVSRVVGKSDVSCAVVDKNDIYHKAADTIFVIEQQMPDGISLGNHLSPSSNLSISDHT